MPDASRFDVDSELYKAIARGGPSRLAEHRSVKLNNVTKYYDPHNAEYQSTFSRSLLELQVIARVSPQWARNIVGVFNRYLAEWCGPQPQPQSGGVLQDIIQTAAKLLDPRTPETERMSLAMKLHADAGAVVDGLRFEDREDAADESPLSKPLASAR
jgi:hypothetical protein